MYLLSISLAAKLAKEFDGRLRISYSGGADYYNIERIVDAGIWPVTVATTLLKPGGYQRLTQMAKLLDKENAPFEKVDAESAGKLAEEAVKDPHHVKAMKPLPSRKMKKEVIKIIANIMEIPEKKIKMENTLIGDLDLESLDIVTLIAELEEKYQIEILDKEIKKSVLNSFY